MMMMEDRESPEVAGHFEVSPVKRTHGRRNLASSCPSAVKLRRVSASTPANEKCVLNQLNFR